MPSTAFPRVRSNLRYVRQVQDGVAGYVVKDPLRLKYFRFGEVETWLMQQMDGTRSLAQVADLLREQKGVRASAEALDPFLRRLKELGLAERTQEERSVLILEAARDQRRSRLNAHGNTWLRMRFSFGDPDEFFNRVIERIRFFWSPGFVVLSAAMFVLYGLIVATHWAAFSQGVAMLYTPAEYTLGLFLTLYVTFAAVAVIHEFGHGLACKHFGGEVHEIGAMLLYFSPAMFCNVNDAWTFENKAHRLWVTFAGGWIQLIVATGAAIVWVSTEPGTLVHQVALMTMVVGGGLVLVLNFNPLIPLDGYYALMDWLEVPNLRARSFEYVGAFLGRGILRLDTPLPKVTPRERRVFLIYGSLALLYTGLLLFFIGWWVAGYLIDGLGGWGWAIVLFAVWLLARKQARRAGRVARVGAAGVLGGSRSRRILGGGTLALVLLVLASVLTPWSVRVEGRAVVEPQQRLWLRPADPGWVDRIVVAEGAAVQAGDVVAVLRNPELELAHTRARSAVVALERQAAAARASGNAMLMRQAEVRLATERTQLGELERRVDALVLRAPLAGRVVTPHLAERIGAHVARGDSLLELWSDGPLRVRVTLPERQAGEVAVGSRIGLKFPVQPHWTWRSRVSQVSPAARERQVELLAPLASRFPAEGPELLRPGMTGEAKVVVRETSIAGALIHRLLHTVRMDWLL
jgi:putative peptide zinc metalloprotease protein